MTSAGADRLGEQLRADRLPRGRAERGALSDRFGRKRLLILAALLFAVTSLGNALAHNFTVFIAWRMLGGVAIGLASSLSPMYISEVAPAQMRGRLVSINQLTIVIGILLAQYINWYLVRDLPPGATDEFIRNSWFGQQGWRWMFGLTAAPSLLFLLGMFFVPESPRWLAKSGQPESARGVLNKIGGKAYANAAIAEIQSTLASEEIQRVRFADLLEPKMRKVLVLGVVLAVFQQWCGINVIFNYAEEIFRAAGYDISTVLKNIAWTGSVNLLFTFVALGAVDRAGRRASHADRRSGLGGDLHRHGLLLPWRREGLAHAAAGAGGHWLLCDVPGPGYLGGDFRDLPQSHPRRGDVRGRDRALDRVFHPHLHLSDVERQARLVRHVLALRGDLRRGVCVHLLQAAGDQGQDPGAARKGLGGLSQQGFPNALMAKSTSIRSVALLLAGLLEWRTRLGAGHALTTFACVILCLGLATPPASRADAATNSAAEVERLFEAKMFRDAQGRALPYRRLAPPKIEPGQRYPLVLLFHGAGERGTDNCLQLRLMLPAFIREENRMNHPCFVLAPQCPPDKRWVEVDWGDAAHTMPPEPSESMALALGLLDEAVAALPVDRERIYVCGASMGGFGTWDALARRPDLFAAALPVCGGADLEQAVRIAHIPVWAFHGDRDTVVLPARSIAMTEAMRNAGGHPKLTLYPGGDHDAWTATFNNPEVFAWLFAQRHAAVSAKPTEFRPGATPPGHTQMDKAGPAAKPGSTETGSRPQ